MARALGQGDHNGRARWGDVSSGERKPAESMRCSARGDIILDFQWAARLYPMPTICEHHRHEWPARRSDRQDPEDLAQWQPARPLQETPGDWPTPQGASEESQKVPVERCPGRRGTLRKPLDDADNFATTTPTFPAFH